MGQKSRWALPQVVHPTTYRKFVICVPNERFYIAAFQGLLIELTYSKNWQRDLAHTAGTVSRVWQEALESVLCDDCGETILMEESDYEMSICEQLRFHNGKLQGFCCGEWVDIAGQLPGDGDGTPPGGDTPQPEPGGCISYHMVLNAQEQWLLPTVVNSGDVISFSNPKGTAQAIPGNLWYCPNGGVFFAGVCTGVFGTDGGDPMPTEAHMGLIAQIAGVWYGSQDPITVPGGVSNAPVIFQVNDGDLADNSGGYSVDIEVCNNQTAAWSHTLPLALNSSGFEIVDAFGCTTGNFGTWTPGTGFEAADCLNATTYYRTLQIQRIFPMDVDFTSVVFTYDLTPGTSPGSTNHLGYVESLDGVGGVTPLGSGTAPGGTGMPQAYNIPFTARGLGMWLGVDSVDVPGPATGSGRVYQLVVSGTGYDPFA